MGRSSNKIYTIDRTDWPYLERVWAWAQDVGVDMYKTRLTRQYVGWCIELPGGSPLETRYLLEFGEHTTNVMGTYYV